ncbi:glycerophosphodiester phosphodiesterase [Ornithinimicrobium cavernae]|uniref:glycerophosphodiester phosphodiesterase n=1 Tax=Ornithinimicrobium cavernae TaxID=2666047 RepID=UPI000D68E7D8|nr:glycerophosphodiester phosphodiesterase [Ornithinimicrobium cavernae]
MRIALTAIATLSLAAPLALAAVAQADPADPPPHQGNNGKGYRATEVIAHRGASGYRPEHTIGAYELAIEQCAGYIEPDLVMTLDGVLVDRHENEISGTTDVAEHPEFADRYTTKVIDGQPLSGWFTEDFTLAELKTLRAVERLPEVRPGNTAYDGLWDVPTFEEVLQLASTSTTCDGDPVGVAPELKHGTYFDGIDLSMEEQVVELLHEYGYDTHRSPAVIQSFEVGNLQELDTMTDVRLAQLVNCSGAPYDQVAAGTGLTYADMVTRQGLKDVGQYADQASFCKDVMIPRNPDGTLGEPTSVIKDAHRAHLTVVGWTFRAENAFLPTEFRSSDDPAELGDMVGEARVFLDAGMDQLFTDHPDLGVEAVQNR